MASRVVGIVLAAGGGTRMGGPKALRTAGGSGSAWVERAASALLSGGCDPVLVVLGAGIEQARAHVPASARMVHAVDWAEGMGASLRAGLLAATAQAPGAEAALVTLVDTPDVGAPVIARVRLAFDGDGPGGSGGSGGAGGAARGGLARAAYGGTPGHPVLIGRDHWNAVAAQAEGDAGARHYLREHDVTLVECGDLATGVDLDAPDDAYPGTVSATPDTHTHDRSRLAEPARAVLLSAVGTEALDVAAHAALVDRADAGAVVTFVGVVRNQDGGREVASIEYVAHPTAQRELDAVVRDVTAGSEAEAVAVSHRVGTLAVGDVALAVAVSGVHRAEAFATASALVDEVKHRLPVWKRQVFTDGTDEWVACP